MEVTRARSHHKTGASQVPTSNKTNIVLNFEILVIETTVMGLITENESLGSYSGAKLRMCVRHWLALECEVISLLSYLESK